MSRKHKSRIVVESTSSNITLLPIPPRKACPFRPKNQSQKDLADKIADNDIIFITGPAGTGKTYCVGMLASEAYLDKEIEQIIATRPAVEAANEEMGFLPGDIDEKFKPWFEPFQDVFERGLGSGHLKYAVEHKKIRPTPMAYMRGKSYDGTWILMDEAQNSTIEQMKMLLTRIGSGSKVIVMGDIKQSDISSTSGLQDAVRRLQGITRVAVHEFTKDDIVRHGLIRDILDRYEN